MTCLEQRHTLRSPEKLSLEAAVGMIAAAIPALTPLFRGRHRQSERSNPFVLRILPRKTRAFERIASRDPPRPPPKDSKPSAIREPKCDGVLQHEDFKGNTGAGSTGVEQEKDKYMLTASLSA